MHIGIRWTQGMWCISSRIGKHDVQSNPCTSRGNFRLPCVDFRFNGVVGPVRPTGTRQVLVPRLFIQETVSYKE